MQGKFDRTIKKMMEQAVSDQLAPLCSGPVLLAVSGGVDSMSMAELFYHSGHHLPFALAHCNFSLRGEESDGDELLVTGWAQKHDVRLFNVCFDTVSYAREHHLSIEMAARDLRYAWFADICRQNGFAAVAVAHNANDNAETLFLNLLRGTGVKGLSGMSFISAMPGAGDVQLIRPLLEFTRKQIEGYAFSNGIAYRNDRTNAEVEYKRNRIRNQVFPLFEKINPSFVRTVNQEMSRFSEAEEILSDYYSSRKDSFMTVSEESAVVDVPALLKEKNWKYLLFRTLETYGFNASVLASLEDLLLSGRTVSGKRFNSVSWQLVTAPGRLLISPSGITGHSPEVVVPGPGIYSFRGKDYEFSLVESKEKICLKQPAGTLVFDATAFPFPFTIREWKKGDWLVPFGMKGRKKVSDFFTDMKFDLLQKESAAMLVKEPDTAAGHISAVLCHRIDDALKVTPYTTSVVMVRVL